jgi:hypothetical protein
MTDPVPPQPQPVPPAPHVSPKVSWPTVTLLALGVAVLVLDQLGVIDVDDTLWVAPQRPVRTRSTSRSR